MIDVGDKLREALAFPYTRTRLPSGLDVIIQPVPEATEVAVHVLYQVGGGDDVAGRSGLAHLFEHLFKNSEHLAGRTHYELLRAVGGRGNASTGSDHTKYHSVVPPHALDLVLWLESDRMGYFLAGLDDDRLAKQREVVRSERRQNYENVAHGVGRIALAEALYPGEHPLRHLTIGRHDEIAGTARADIENWYRTWYVPANAVLVIVGAVEATDAMQRVQRYFGSFPTSTRPLHACPTTPAIAKGASLEVIDPRTTRRRLQWVFRGPTSTDADELSLAVLADILSRPGVGPLWKQLVYEKPWAQRVGAGRGANRLAGEFSLVVDLRPEASIDEVRASLVELVAASIAGFAGELDLDASVQAVKRRGVAAMMWPLESMQHRAAQTASSVAVFDEPDWGPARYERMTALSADVVVNAAKRWLAAPHLEMVTMPAQSA